MAKGGQYPVNPDDSRVKRAIRYLHELETSGVELHEIFGGEAGVAFIRDGCEGDPEVAYAAFTLVHAPTSQGHHGVGKTKNPSEN
jgi:hypothetical protein